MWKIGKSRYKTVLALIVLAIGLVITAVAGLWVYMLATTTPIHPNPKEITSVTRSTPMATRADAVTQARQIVRADVAEQNLPGLSIAVGVDGGIAWAEGFGWADVESRGTCRARDAVQNRRRLHGAHLGRRRPPPRAGPAETRRRDPEVRAGVPEKNSGP
jgi:hypothetical protein